MMLYMTATDPKAANGLRHAAYSVTPITEAKVPAALREAGESIRAVFKKLIKAGRARNVTRNGDSKTAFELWRILHKMFDPQHAGTEAASVTNIMRPRRAKSANEVIGVIEPWENSYRSS